VKISDLATAADIHDEDVHSDPEYAAEHERTRFANEVAVMVLKYRAEHRLSQTGLARMLGMRQPNIARLESGEHEPTISTLMRLSAALGLDFAVDVRHGHADIRELADAS
jgi:ribosome-binding protein aMBF1 (putative translation factor)